MGPGKGWPLEKTFVILINFLLLIRRFATKKLKLKLNRTAIIELCNLRLTIKSASKSAELTLLFKFSETHLDRTRFH